MKKISKVGGGLVEVKANELQKVVGGFNFKLLERIIRYTKYAVSFALEYKDDFVNGFEKGWNKY